MHAGTDMGMGMTTERVAPPLPALPSPGPAGRLRDMNRLLALLAAVAILTAPALAAEWGHYVNERFGVEADVPPGFEPGAEPANGDGLRFSTPTADLAIYGSFLVADDFEAEARQQITFAEAEGWGITYQAVTPGWAVWSGRKGSRILYARAVPICSGGGIGAFQLTYMQADLKRFDPVVERLGRSLRDSGTGWQC